MASATAAGVARPRPAPWVAGLRRLAPAEGWSTVLLHAAMLLAAAWTVERADWALGRSAVALAALGGMLAGIFLAKSRAPDLLAHVIAFWVGLAVAVWTVVERLDPALGGRRDRLRHLWELALEWYRASLAGRRLDDEYLFLVVMDVTVWLVAYTSAWVLYRRGWPTTATLLPGIIVVVNLGYAPDGGTAPLLVFVVAACLFAARHHAYRREREWARSRLPRPPRLPWRFLGAGANLALLAAILAWTLPLTARDAAFDAAWERLAGPAAAIEERWGNWLADWGRDGSAGGRYASFGEAFDLGGALRLGDDPVLILRNGGDDEAHPAYLVGHRYNAYDGRGWASDVRATFDETGGGRGRYSPQMEFARGQGINLTPEVTTARSTVTGTLEVLQPKGSLLFTTDTVLAVDRRTNVQLSWRPLDDEAYDLRGDNPLATLNAIPFDLRGFAGLLLQATFPVPAAGGAVDSPLPRDPALGERIVERRAELERRFLATRWEVGPDGRATTLYATGQLPVYDDVEAVFAHKEAAVAPGQTYTVTAYATTAAPAELRRAGTDYPGWVEARYLELPDTVTPRTRELAARLATDQDTPFDVALAVQNFVRERIAYEEEIDAPPRGRDVVDYVLFESQEGYCEYYASAMAVLLRTQNIPARVVGGYFPVPYDQEVDGFVYTEKNAHLWVEVYFPGYGWIPFEPTASRETLDYGDLSSPTDPLATPEPEPTPAATEAPMPEPSATEPPGAVPPPDDGSSLLGRPAGPLGWASLVTGLLVLLGVLAASLVWLSGLRGLSPAGGVYARAIRAGRWWGVRATPAMTPTEYAARLGRTVPAARVPAHAVADLYSQELYAGRSPTSATTRSARAAWSELRRALLRSLPRRLPFRRRGGTGGLGHG